jgi:hypothetical protein
MSNPQEIPNKERYWTYPSPGDVPFGVLLVWDVSIALLILNRATRSTRRERDEILGWQYAAKGHVKLPHRKGHHKKRASLHCHWYRSSYRQPYRIQYRCWKCKCKPYWCRFVGSHGPPMIVLVGVGRVERARSWGVRRWGEVEVAFYRLIDERVFEARVLGDKATC